METPKSGRTTGLICIIDRRFLLKAQVAQGALLGPLIHPPQDYVLCPLERTPRQAQRMSSRILGLWTCVTFVLPRPAHYPSAKTTRSELFEESSRVVRARFCRCTARSGLSMSTVSSGTSRTAPAPPLAFTPAMLLSPPSSWTRIGESCVFSKYVQGLMNGILAGLSWTGRTGRSRQPMVATSRSLTYVLIDLWWRLPVLTLFSVIPCRPSHPLPTPAKPM